MDAYVGEIRMFAGSFAPVSWAFCDGQLLRIRDNQMLYALIGTRYGGDGANTFALPDLRGRVPVHQGAAPGGSSYALGEAGGAERVALAPAQLPAHTHAVSAQSKSGTAESPAGGVWAVSGQSQFADAANASMAPGALTPAGGTQPHDNMMPFLPVGFIICLDGLWPNRE